MGGIHRMWGDGSLFLGFGQEQSLLIRNREVEGGSKLRVRDSREDLA